MTGSRAVVVVNGVSCNHRMKTCSTTFDENLGLIAQYFSSVHKELFFIALWDFIEGFMLKLWPKIGKFDKLI